MSDPRQATFAINSIPPGASRSPPIDRRFSTPAASLGVGRLHGCPGGQSPVLGPENRRHPGGLSLIVPLVQSAQNVVPVAVTAGDKIEGLRQWASGRCLSADRAGVYSRAEIGGGKGRRVMREPGVN